MSQRSTVQILADLLRPKTCLLGAVFMLLGIYLSGQRENLPYARIIGGMIVVGLCIAYGYVINDYKDAKLDHISKPHRPIPAGGISHQAVLMITLGLASSSLFISFLLGILPMLFTLTTLLLATAYSFYLKSIPLLGNSAMGLLNASILVFGGLLADSVNQPILAVSFAFFIYSLAHEILYAVEDLPGDIKGGIQTTATVLGEAASLRLYSGIATGLAILSLLPWFLGYSTRWYGYAAFFCCAAPALWTVLLLTITPTPETVRHSRRVLTTMRFLGLMPVLLLIA